MALTKIKQCMTKLPFSNRNKIINGNFNIWQRGVSQTTSGYGSDDRWINQHVGSTKTHSRQAFAIGETFPDGTQSPTFYSRTVVNSVAGAGNYCHKQYRVESVHTLAGKKATLSFWAKANTNKNITIEFGQVFGTGGSPSTAVYGIGSQLIALTTIWKKYVLTVDIPSIVGKNLGTNIDDFLQLDFWFDAGSNWNSRTLSLGQQSGTFDIAQVQLEEGPVATPFEDRSVAEEWLLCQRYYEITRSVAITPTTASVWHLDYVYFSVPKRTSPIITSSQAGAGNGNFNTRTPGTLTQHGVIWGAAATATIVGGGWADVLYVDAEL